MKSVAVVGSGAREHAIAWKLAQSNSVSRVVVVPGNPGMPSEWERWLISLSQGQTAFEAIAQRCLDQKIDLVVIGPDNPLADGISDVLRNRGITVMGPSAKAAKIESSKRFAKELMQEMNVPTGKYWVAESPEQATEILLSLEWPLQASQGGWVIKADGLAFGKGVRVCSSLVEAKEAMKELSKFGPPWIIEERLSGEEVSWMAFCDGDRFALMEPARDYKRHRDGDQGLNTGGMGSFSPVLISFPNLKERVKKEVFEPIVKGMKEKGTPFQGVLYAGLMINPGEEKFWVLEFNARFGDPETQVVLPRLDGDFFQWCYQVAVGDLSALPEEVPFISETALYVVAASEGYPSTPVVGKTLEVDQAIEDFCFFAGVRRESRDLVTAGGRVLGVLGMGPSLEDAKSQAYQRISKARFEGMVYRKDIGDSRNS